MYTKSERKALETALRRVEKCNGNCANCKYHHVYFSEVDSHPTRIYMAFGCDVLPQKIFSAISSSPKTRPDAIESLEFELSLPYKED